ncbi:MAG: N-acetylneuraminate synthase family protein [Alphaproteobacteria bacterium]|nr:N-acetylneuraminate synthase family protein [Alphaproteobacteria bacterium]
MKNFSIENRKIGPGEPCYIIAEISCNHDGDIDEARAIIKAAAEAGADAVKLQTYKPETITRNFQTRPKGTIWENTDLFSLYQKAYTPWEWYGELKKCADEHGLHIFSSPFDETAVDFLETQNVPAYKVASFEVVDIKLLQKVAATGKPIIISNGMTDYLELKEAVDTLRRAGVKDLAVLHCNSGYPAAFDEANLNTIPAIEKLFECVTGLSDHTLFADPTTYTDALAHVTAFEAVKKGAKIIEVHLMLDRTKARALMEKNEGGFDWPFSREPHELKKTIDLIRAHEAGNDIAYETELEKKTAALTHGNVCFEPTTRELASRNARPSLWVVEDIKAEEPLKFCGGKPGNFDSIRPGGGLHIRYADALNGATAARDLKAGEPLQWDMVKL